MASTMLKPANSPPASTHSTHSTHSTELQPSPATSGSYGEKGSTAPLSVHGTTGEGDDIGSPGPPKGAKKDARFWLIFGTLCCCCFLSALDLTAVSTALPTSTSSYVAFLEPRARR